MNLILNQRIPRRTGVPDRKLPALDAALDARHVGELLNGACADLGPFPEGGTVTYVRYKPETSLVAGYRFGEPDSVAARLGYAKLVPEARLRQEVEKAQAIASGRTGARIVVLDPYPLVFSVFPFDRSVRGLRLITEPGKMKRRASVFCVAPGDGLRISGKRSRLSLLRYKPERRAVLDADLAVVSDAGPATRRRLHVKAYGDGTAVRTFRVMRALESAGPADSLPRFARALDIDSAQRVLFQEWVDGVRLSEVEDPAGNALRAGQCLAALHDLDVAAPELAGAAIARTPESALARARDLSRFFERIAPGRVAVAAARLVRRLEATLPPAERPALIHGDFYDHQVLCHPSGPAFVDFDEAGPGDPRFDVGNFLAHATRRDAAHGTEAVADPFLEGYRSRGRGADRLSWFTALSLLRLSVVPFRNLRPGWSDEAEAILAAALREAGA